MIEAKIVLQNMCKNYWILRLLFGLFLPQHRKYEHQQHNIEFSFAIFIPVCDSAKRKELSEQNNYFVSNTMHTMHNHFMDKTIKLNVLQLPSSREFVICARFSFEKCLHSLARTFTHRIRRVRVCVCEWPQPNETNEIHPCVLSAAAGNLLFT